MSVPERSTTYTVGGQAPQGWKGTPMYTQSWVPKLGIDETALYERQDWQATSDATQQSYSNPPFIGEGNSGHRIPQWMQAHDAGGVGIKRILRGYIRRHDVYPFNAPGMSSSMMASNARLYFMYNPTDIQRSYLSFTDWSTITNPNAYADINASTAPLMMTTFNLELFFDREEEVATLPDHPGVLIDLKVFDTLVQGGATPGELTDWSTTPGDSGTGYIQPNSGLSQQLRDAVGAIGALAPAAGGTTTSGGDAAIQKTDSSGLDDLVGKGLYIDYSTNLVVVFSPYMSIRGHLNEVNVVFEKFSHRMTPTRMRMALTFVIDYMGAEPPINYVDPAKERAASEANAAAAAKQLYDEHQYRRSVSRPMSPTTTSTNSSGRRPWRGASSGCSAASSGASPIVTSRPVPASTTNGSTTPPPTSTSTTSTTLRTVRWGWTAPG